MEVTAAALRAMPIVEPWLSAGLVRLGGATYLAKWESEQPAPTLQRIRLLEDVALFGITADNIGSSLLSAEAEAWTQRYGFAVAALPRADLDPPVPSLLGPAGAGAADRPPPGTVTTVVSTGACITPHTGCAAGDGGPAARAIIAGPPRLAFGRDGSLYLATTESVRRIAPDGTISTVPGAGDADPDRPAAAGGWIGPGGVAVAPDGVLYVSDARQNRIVRLGAGGTRTVVAGNGAVGFAGDGCPATQVPVGQPGALALAPDGSLYLAQGVPPQVRRLDPDGCISTVAGPSGEPRALGATDVAVGPDGSVYVADVAEHRVLRLRPDGASVEVAGTGPRGFRRRPGQPPSRSLYGPNGIAVDRDGRVYLADGSGGVRRVEADGTLRTVLEIPATSVAVGPEGDVYATLRVDETVGYRVARIWGAALDASRTD